MIDFDLNLDGVDELEGDVIELSDTEITAGLHDDSGSYDEGLSLVDVYMINANGSKEHNIPPRPFITMAVTDDRIEEGMALAESVFNGDAPDFDKLGKQMKDAIQEIVYSGDKLKPNAPSTVNKKGFDWPMVETGQMFDAINYKIRK